MASDDQLGVAANKNFMKKLAVDENILLSLNITKFNPRNKGQQRGMIVSAKNVYNVKGKSFKIQRQISLPKIVGITQSRNSGEFVIHCPDEYDYRFLSPESSLIVTRIAEAHLNLLTGNPQFFIWEADEPDLREYQTNKKDKKKNLSKIPRKETAINFNVNVVPASREESKGAAPGGDRSTTIYASGEESKNQVNLDDFKILKVIGRGSFGKVMLVEKKDTGNIYAMKSLRKDSLIEKGQVEHTKTEKMVMEHINHPFLTRLEFAFSTADKIFFVMQYMRGGELFFHLKEARKFPEPRAKFYAAQLLLGLDHLHTENIIYRDLKPENVIMDDVGNVCLTDFGMAKRLQGDSTTSFCGTPEYLAPEIITCRGHGKPADWWSFGILLYEMMVGVPPFYNQNIQLMYELIQHGEIKFPQKQPISPQAQDLINKLLNRDQYQRLGSKNGGQDIKDHPFFEGCDWQAIYDKAVEPPFRPNVSGDTDTGNFDEEFTNEDPAQTISNETNMKLIQQNQSEFDDF